MIEKKFYVYILRCKDNSLYTGYTVNIDKRLEKHNIGKASKYTRARLPVKLLYYEECKTKSEALVRDKTIKKLKKNQKEKLITENENHFRWYCYINII